MDKIFIMCIGFGIGWCCYHFYFIGIIKPKFEALLDVKGQVKELIDSIEVLGGER